MHMNNQIMLCIWHKVVRSIFKVCTAESKINVSDSTISEYTTIITNMRLMHAGIMTNVTNWGI